MNDRQMSHDSNNNHGDFICGVVEGFYGRPWSCEQRKDLFKRLAELKMNAFMYAPKDDAKHRAKWRQLYSESEARELKTLIDGAKANGIDFYYSLAPGLDMVYSNREELDLLVRKYDQLVELGCKSFAILFDDIEPSIINEQDREVFKNYASAQVAVANMIFEHLRRPKFLFCPTEYCESRAVPNVSNSIYLRTLGTGLLGGIDIMWSGSRVVSRFITEESIELLAESIKRPPVIWENLHANDYDKKRVYLGPYSGRSTKIIPKLRGILTNPNCEYEANYVALHTLATWSRCTEDINPHNQCNPNHRFPCPDQDGAPLLSSVSFNQISESVYCPERALVLALRDWLPHMLASRSLPSGVNLTNHLRYRNDDLASDQLVKEGDYNEKDDIDVEDNNVEMVLADNQSSDSNGTNRSDMDISNSPAPQQTNLIDANSYDSCEMQDAIEPDEAKSEPLACGAIDNGASSELKSVANDVPLLDCIMCSAANTTTQGAPTDVSPTIQGILNLDNLSLLVDMYYLPFEHGSYGYSLLKDLKWLRDNSDIMINRNSYQDDPNHKETLMTDDDSDPDRTVCSWTERANRLNSLCNCVGQLVNALIYECPNKLLIIELYPYLADLRDAISMVIDYIKFLRYRSSTLDRFYCSNGSRHKETTSSDEQEPWVHRGGLIGDVQRLLS